MRVLTSLLFVVSACGSSPDVDSGQRIVVFDAGTSAPAEQDSGVNRPTPTPVADAGSTPRDTGEAADAGAQPVADAGRPQERDTGTEPPVVGDAPSYTDRGQFEVAREELRVQATSECTMTAVRYRPTNPVVRGYALFLHGFARGRSQFLGWGAHLASHGIETVVSDLCHASVSGVDPVAGGEAIDTLIQNIGDTPVVIIGHSAGSMAALVAGAQNDATVAVLGLDPVAPREGNLDAQAADLDGMLAALVGAPSQCNSNNSGVEIYRQGNAAMMTIAGATHCDFEAPTNFLCTAACGGSAGEGAQAAIRQLVTSFAAWKLGLPAAAAWWDEDSESLEGLINSGQVAPVR